MKPIKLEYKTYEELKEELGNEYDTAMYEINISALKEIERLNHIINELEKDLYDNAERCKDNFNETQDIKWLDFIEIYICIADKLQELKGDEK